MSRQLLALVGGNYDECGGCLHLTAELVSGQIEGGRERNVESPCTMW